MDNKNNFRLTEIPENYYGFIYHYYRAEVYRETNWRNRLDNTTNWAIVVSAGIISLVLNNESISHAVLVVNYLIAWYFLYIESRRFRYYLLLRRRTRTLEKFIISPIFTKRNKLINARERLRKLSISLSDPHVPVSRLESLAWRIRRSYMFIFSILLIVWLMRVSVVTDSGIDIWASVENAGFFIIPGIAVFALMIFSVITAVILAFYLPFSSHHDDLP